MTPLLGFVPDLAPSTPGAVVDCTNVIPVASGLAGAPTAVAVTGVPALADECRNAVVVTKLAGSRRTFAGTEDSLYELSAGVWEDRSRVGGYTLGTDGRWDFTQFGDATLAAAEGHVIQRSNGTGDFADISGAPQAKIIEAASGFVVAFNTNFSSDTWHCCAKDNELDWVQNLTTQSNSGRLVSTPGAITAAKALGDQIVAYKDRSIYVGTFVDDNRIVWKWDAVPGDVGCVGMDAVTDLGGLGHVLVGRSDILLFDGTRAVSIAEGKVRQWFYDNVAQNFLYRSVVLHDKQTNTIWIFYPSRLSETPDSALVHHLGTQQWGRLSVVIESAMNYVSAGVTIDGMGGTIDELPDVSFDSQYWLAGGRLMTVFTSAHQLSTLSGVAGSSSMTMFEIGDDQIVTMLKRVRVAYERGPTSATVTGRAKMARGDALAAGGSGIYSGGKFDIRQSGRLHQVRIDAVGDWIASGVDFDAKPAGQR